MSMHQDLIHSLDPVMWAGNCLHIEPDPWQAQVLRSDSRRLLLNCSRQSGKSTIAAVVALHRAIFYPNSLILLVSPSLRQSSELFRKVTDWINVLRERPERTEDNRLSCTFKNNSRIVSLPSKEETIRGFSGATLIIEDEASRVSDDLYRAVRPMLAVSGGRIILMSTPFGKRGHFFDEWSSGGKVWERIMIPATECPRISQSFLDEERRALGEWWFKQEYLCVFTETTDQVFSYDLIAAAITDDIKPLFDGGIS